MSQRSWDLRWQMFFGLMVSVRPLGLSLCSLTSTVDQGLCTLFSCSVNNSFYLSACLFNRSKIVVGVLNVVLTLSISKSVSLCLTVTKVGCLWWIHSQSAHTYHSKLQVSTNTSTSQLGWGTCVHRLQTVLHSVLSTQVMLHTATMLRQDLIDSWATVAQTQYSNNIWFAEVMTELVPEGVEVEEAQR